MKIKLERYNKRKDLIKVLPEFINYKIISNLGYFKFNTWKRILKNRKSKQIIFDIFTESNFVGLVALVYEKQYRSWSITYFIFKKYWNKGIATLATKEVLKYAFKNKIKKIHAETRTDNFGSIRVLEKNKFKKIKENKREIFWEKKLK
ncbi:GNAT family N-acetyltransferase [Candidatus Pacearchaeota archaeon]|nr:GNAT family N-acetyltransferase [Candidatus Pacearchaeota archaeon]